MTRGSRTRRPTARPVVTRQTVTAFVAAGVFTALAVLIAVLPVPYVTWSPGQTHDVLATGADPVIRIEGIQTYPTSGRLDLTVVSTTSVDSWLSLPQALIGYWRPGHDTLPRDVVYPPQKSDADVQAEDAQMMVSAQDDAVIAALRADHQPVTERPVVASVVTGGPSEGKLLPGDVVVSVAGETTASVPAVLDAVGKGRAGTPITFVVLRNQTRTTVSVVPVARDSGGVRIGITLATDYTYAPKISYDLGSQIGGPSAGLVFALAIYDKITPGALIGDRHVAGTGTIDPTGAVGAIGGIQEKIAGAEKAGATTFLVPAPNCGDVVGVSTSMRLVKVTNLSDAVSSVSQLGSADATLPTC